MNARMDERPDGRAMKPRSLAARLSLFFSSGRRLIAAAALFHVALAVGLFCVGRAQVAPRFLDRDAIIVGSDSYEYQAGAARLAEVLKQDGLRAWAVKPERAHVKLISLQFAVLSPLFGYSALSAEPFNLFCYVAILSLVLLLGREVGGRRAGLRAACIVALWPTLLLHTTQLLKDPLFIAAALALILVVTTWLTRTYRLVNAVAMGALMAVAMGALLLIRVKFGAIIFVIVLFGFALLVARQLIERRWLYWNLVSPLLILCVGGLALFFLTTGREKYKQYPSNRGGLHKSVAMPGRQVPSVISYARRGASPKTPPGDARPLSALTEAAVSGIGGARYKYNVGYPKSGSAIDRNVEFENWKSLILYLPRAFVIGFFAPFPDTWIGTGQSVGGAGRVLAGAETLTMYLCELLVLVGIWRRPRCLPSWLLLLIAAFGMTVLGLVVSNVGTLYRFRYLFWILLIILAAQSLENIFSAWRAPETGDRPAGEHLTK
jgi:4-amino-4-deoxy-L-arabinose transferase-like glycosyltransferase